MTTTTVVPPSETDDGIVSYVDGIRKITKDCDALSESGATARTVDTSASHSDSLRANSNTSTSFGVIVAKETDMAERSSSGGSSSISTTSPTTKNEWFDRHRQPTKSAMKVKTLDLEESISAPSKKEKNGSTRRFHGISTRKLRDTLARVHSKSRTNDLTATDNDEEKSVITATEDDPNEGAGGHKKQDQVHAKQERKSSLAHSERSAHSNQSFVAPLKSDVTTGNVECRRNAMTKMKQKSRPSMRSLKKVSGSMRHMVSTSKSKLFSSLQSLSSLLSHETQEDLSRGPTVSFYEVEIREYELSVSDNPSVSRGAALSLGWNYTSPEPLPLETYEEFRPVRRTMKEMAVPPSQRKALLLASGVSNAEIDAAIKRSNVLRAKRRKTLAQLHHYTLHEKVEGAKRKFLKLMGVKKSVKKEEEDLWESAQCYFDA